MHNAILPENPMEELEQNKKLAEQQLSGKELYDLKKRQREAERNQKQKKESFRKAPKKILPYAIIVLIVLIFIGAIGAVAWLVITSPKVPPTTAQGHTEDMPQSHITDIPIPDSMQRHMLEHADGKGKSGIIIQYNCKKYACEPDLFAKLTDLVKKYPDNVYLAPNDYDGKIILTKLGKVEILDNFNEQAIKDFIN